MFINRRYSTQILWCLLGILIGQVNNCSSQQKNIILINVDDLGIQYVGSYGQEVIKTPHLDLMASEGVRFQNGYSGATTCGPSRASLLLGKHLGHINQRKNGGQCYIRDGELCFPELLQRGGYNTAMFGKHHNARFYKNQPLSDLPNGCGFDLFVGSLKAMAAHRFFIDGVTSPQKNYPKHLWRIENDIVTPYPIDPKRYTHNEYVDLALDYLEDQKDSTYFMYLSFQIPHYELVVPEKGHPDYDPEDEGLLEQYLNENGSSIFTSDNGPLGIGSSQMKINNLLKGGKGSLYEGGVKVPFIFWGGGTMKGKMIKEPIIAYDLGTTILDLAEIKEPYNSDGISWAPTLLGENPLVREYLYWENYHSVQCQSTLIGNRYKVLKVNCAAPQYSVELYDLSVDPSEKNNLSTSEDYAHIIERAKEIFSAEHVPNDRFSIPN